AVRRDELTEPGSQPGSALIAFAGIDAPHETLFDPALIAVEAHTAPFAVARQDLANGSRFDEGDGATIAAGFPIEGNGCLLAFQPWRRHAGARARQQGLKDPAL